MWNVALANIKYNCKNVWNSQCHHCYDWWTDKNLACANQTLDSGSSTKTESLSAMFHRWKPKINQK